MTGIEGLQLDPDIRAAFATRLQQYIPTERNTDGANGVVVFALNSVTEQEVAIKFHDSDGGRSRHAEPRALSSVDSPNVLRVLDAGTISDTLAYFITPRCSGGSLEQVLSEPISTRQAIYTTIQIANGLVAIHARGMVHRDIKPGNIVVESGRPMIADFGSVRIVPYVQSAREVSQHTALYRPPEIVEGALFTVQGDVYQLGVVAYELLGGRLGRTEVDLLSGREIAQLRALTDAVGRSRFVDECIRSRARRGKLVDLRSLPAWVEKATCAVLRRMTTPDLTKRFASVGAAITALHSAQTTQLDWSPHEAGATLKLKDRVLRVTRERNSGLFVAEQDRGSGFRRVPGQRAASLEHVVNWAKSLA